MFTMKADNKLQMTFENRMTIEIHLPDLAPLENNQIEGIKHSRLSEIQIWRSDKPLEDYSLEAYRELQLGNYLNFEVHNLTTDEVEKYITWTSSHKGAKR